MAIRRANFWIGLVLALGLVTTAAGVAGAADPLLGDGSFEHPVLPANGAAAFQKGDAVGPWSVSHGVVSLFTAVPGSATPRRGAQFLALSGRSAHGGGTVCQRLSGLVAGAPYTLRLFAASLNPNTGSTATSTIDVRLDDARIGSLDLASTVPVQWTRASLPFTADAPHERLCIEGTPSDIITFPLVDAITITPATS